jgi:HEAT repeat protein
VVLGLLALSCAIVWWFAAPKEPSYRSKSFYYWMKRAPSEEASIAFRSMGEKAVPFLVKELQWKPSAMIQRLQRRFPNFPLTMNYAEGATDPRSGAAYALGEIGSSARAALSNLHAISVVSDLPSSWYVNVAAKAAIIKIKGESLDPYIEELKDTSDCLKWYPKALLVGQFGTNAVAAVPLLLASLDPTNHEVIHGHALVALGEIHSRPDACVPAIAVFLKSPSVSSRQKAVCALTAFGRDAKSAVPQLISTLSDLDPWTRSTAADALKKIDPAAAQQNGVK